MAYETVEVRKLTGGCGAEVLGVDLKSMSNRQWDEVQRAFAEHGVIFFRDQKLTPEQHIEFARRWAPIDVNRFFKAVQGYPEIAEVRKEPEQKTNIGGGWHTDHSYDAGAGDGLDPAGARAAGGGRRHAVRQHVPRLRGALARPAAHARGHARGARLGAHLRRQGRERGQSRRRPSRYGNQHLVGDDVVHPVVIRHPLSGRKALYVNAAFTLRFEGWTAEDSRPLLEHLYRHASRPEFTCRFRWREGSIAFWDNRATWHYAANDYHGERRLMHRITVAGCALQPATGVDGRLRSGRSATSRRCRRRRL